MIELIDKIHRDSNNEKLNEEVVENETKSIENWLMMDRAKLNDNSPMPCRLTFESDES